MLIQQYAERIEAHLPTIQSEEIERIRSVTDPHDEADISLAHHLIDRVKDGTTTRFLTAAAIIACWALYETAVQDIAAYFQTKRRLRLALSAIRGDFLERARTYFDDVLRFPLHDSAADWSRLEALARLRHFLAHGNGDIRNLSEQKQKAFPTGLRRLTAWSWLMIATS